jgi:hypothetical protein
VQSQPQITALLCDETTAVSGRKQKFESKKIQLNFAFIQCPKDIIRKIMDNLLVISPLEAPVVFSPGTPVTFRVASAVAFSVCFTVDFSVRSAVTFSVCFPVGFSVGFSVRPTVALSVGFSVRTSVAFSVCFEVGLSVGGTVAFCVSAPFVVASSLSELESLSSG